MIGPKTPSLGKRSRAQVNKIRDDIFLRDDFQCVCAGSKWALKWPCMGQLSIQHAMGRGMGGSALMDRPELLRTMCVVHNVLLEADADFAGDALLLGWRLERRRGDIDPTDVPVRYWDGRDYRLFPEGFGRALVLPVVAAEWRATYYGKAVA